ncbi:MAG: DegT/DnrJ/EryC1/StrS family aminotransferase [Planctomycetes bacterium]|nr:DegT/DnrJ/EryC1/StrS family aminotransferase [Planctomycetota bacterium]
MQVPLLDLKSQFATIKDAVMPAIDEVCQSQLVCLGPAVQQFETKIAAYCQCRHAVGVSSGSDALIVALMAIDLQPGDEVITTPFTFFATAAAIVRLGGKPVFVDVDPESYNIDPNLIEERITDKTRAIVPVHLFGQMAPMVEIDAIAQKHGLRVIEDAAQAIGSLQEGSRCGSRCELGCFSFYPTKNLGAFGDGGLVTTNDDALAEKLRILRDHGQNPRYHYQMVGGNFRLDGIQGAVLSVKLDYLDNWSDTRRRHASLYDERLASSCVKTPNIAENNLSAYHQYTIRAPRRDDLQRFLGDHQIETAIFYPKPLHLQSCFSYLDYGPGAFPVTETLCEEVLSLPICPELSEEQIERTAERVLAFYQH